MKNKEEALKGIIDSTRENKPAKIGPLVEKLMAEKAAKVAQK